MTTPPFPPDDPTPPVPPDEPTPPVPEPGAPPAADPQTGSTAEARAAVVAVRDEIAKVVVGQDGVITGLITALLVRGHVLLEGVPGTAKTLMAGALSAALALDTNRVQFTPDLMPSDVLGQSVYDSDAQTLEGAFRFRAGPVFTNVLLADEINRTPPRTQAALLEAMEERRVSVEGTPRDLPDPFMVIATQNPIEYEGTYPLPEAQLDRFLLKLVVGYPSAEEEVEVLARHDRGMNPHRIREAGVRAVADAATLRRASDAAMALRTDPAVLGYLVAIANASRQSPSLSLGVSPRGSTMLLRAAKAWAWLSGRDFVTPDDVKQMALPALRHRVQVRPDVELEGGDADGVLRGLLASVPVPR